MKLNPAVLLAAFSCLIISSCASTQTAKPEPAKTVEEGPKLVGRVASIPADRRFVLIQSYGKWTIESGRILTTRGPDDRAANLRTTGETLGEFAAADLQSGTVEVGDAVYSQHIAKPAEMLTTPELPQPENQALLENVQKNN
jgi:hypothetical protein